MRFSKALLAIAVSTALTACGGSSSSDTTSTTDPTTDTGDTTATTTTVSEGVITGFGSVYVNGKRYRSENANIAVSNSPAADEAQLKVGMVVTVAASESEDGEDPEAQEIRYEAHLQGPISFIDTEAGQIEVLGQVINYDDVTEFEPEGVDTLTIGDFIEVSGYLNDDGSFYATLVELETEETEIRLKGEVTALDTEAQTFTISDLTIDYSAAEFEDMTAEDLADGLFVKVEGSDYDSETMTLVAASIENKDDVEIDEDAESVTIAGIVKDYDAEAGTFTVNRYDFTLADSTEFEDGTIDTLTNGVRVKVEGSVDGDSLIATEVEFKAERARSKTEGQVTAVEAETEQFVVHGITFSVTPETRYKDESDMDERRFTFDDIAVNDWLKVISRTDAEGNAVALKVKRVNEEEREGEVKGEVSDISREGMVVEGVEVRFTEDTDFDTDDDRISLADFIELVTTSEHTLIVEVEGEYDGEVLVATDIEVEMEDDESSDDGDGEGDGDGEANDNTGKVEFKGEVESQEGDLVFVNGHELRFTQESELELNDQEVGIQDFFAAIEPGVVIEVEGVWVEQTYIKVLEAEIETETEEE